MLSTPGSITSKVMKGFPRHGHIPHVGDPIGAPPRRDLYTLKRSRDHAKGTRIPCLHPHAATIEWGTDRRCPRKGGLVSPQVARRSSDHALAEGIRRKMRSRSAVLILITLRPLR